MSEATEHSEPSSKNGQEDRVPGRNGGTLKPPWQPGKSANPGGRPKGASIQAPFLRKMAADPNEHGEGALAVEYADQFHDAINNGDFDRVRMLLSVMERTDGPLKQQIEHSGAVIPPLRVEASSAEELARIERLAGTKAVAAGETVAPREAGAAPPSQRDNGEH